MNHLPPFYVGQRVVVIENHSSGCIKKDEVYTVRSISKPCCGWVITIGVEHKSSMVQCSTCNKMRSKDREWPFRVELFAPIESTFTQISYERVMELESPSINVN